MTEHRVGRVHAHAESRGSGRFLSPTIHYDANPFGSSVNTAGRLAAVTFAGQPVQSQPNPNFNFTTTQFAYQYRYTSAGQVTAKNLNLTRGYCYAGTCNGQIGGAMEADYSYDNEGRMTSLAYPMSGPTFTYGYDAMGRASTLNQTAGSTTMFGSAPSRGRVACCQGCDVARRSTAPTSPYIALEGQVASY